MIAIDELSLDDWICIYEHLDGDFELSLSGRKTLKLMKLRLKSAVGKANK